MYFVRICYFLEGKISDLMMNMKKGSSGKSELPNLLSYVTKNLLLRVLF